MELEIGEKVELDLRIEDRRLQALQEEKFALELLETDANKLSDCTESEHSGAGLFGTHWMEGHCIEAGCSHFAKVVEALAAYC